MIKTLTIENFQSHVKTIITPAELGRLTVITGPSDSGKTAVLRALRWVLFNEPQGSDFIRVGASFARVTLETSGGAVVVRERSKSFNRYKIIHAGQQAQVFEGFGSNVPLEVQEVTGVRIFRIGDLELNLNLSEQLDGPFLGKSISAGARAKILGKLAGTEEIDFASKQLSTDLYRNTQDDKRLTGELVKLIDEIAGYDWLDAAALKIKRLQELADSIREMQSRSEELSVLRGELGPIEEKVSRTGDIIYYWRNVEEADNLKLRVIYNMQTREPLRSLNSRFNDYSFYVQAAEREAALYVEILPEAEQAVSAVQDAATRKEALSILHNRYAYGVAAINEINDFSFEYAGIEAAEQATQGAMVAKDRRDLFASLQNSLLQAEESITSSRGEAVLLENRVKELEGAYHDLLDMAGVCPLCGQEIKPTVKEAV